MSKINYKDQMYLDLNDLKERLRSEGCLVQSATNEYFVSRYFNVQNKEGRQVCVAVNNYGAGYDIYIHYFPTKSMGTGIMFRESLWLEVLYEAIQEGFKHAERMGYKLPKTIIDNGL